VSALRHPKVVLDCTADGAAEIAAWDAAGEPLLGLHLRLLAEVGVEEVAVAGDVELPQGSEAPRTEACKSAEDMPGLPVQRLGELAFRRPLARQLRRESPDMQRIAFWKVGSADEARRAAKSIDQEVHFPVSARTTLPVARALVVPLARLGVPPNLVTLALVAVGAAAAVFIALGTWHYDLAAAGLMIVYLFGDTVDGLLARYAGRESRVGAGLDGATDSGACSAILAVLAYRAHVYVWPLPTAWISVAGMLVARHFFLDLRSSSSAEDERRAREFGESGGSASAAVMRSLPGKCVRLIVYVLTLPAQYDAFVLIAAAMLAARLGELVAPVTLAAYAVGALRYFWLLRRSDVQAGRGSGAKK